MTEEVTKSIDQNSENQQAISELNTYLPGVLDSFYTKLAGDPALQQKAREIAKGGDRSYTLFMLLNSDGPGFKEHIADIFKKTTYGARSETVVIESIANIMDKKDLAKADAEKMKNEFRLNKVDELLKKAA